MNCDVCGKDTMMEDGKTSVIGMTLELRHEDDTKEYHTFLQKQIGDYEIGRKYVVCWECLLRSLGIRPTHGRY